MLEKTFFDRDSLEVAKNIIGKVIYHKYKDIWLAARIIETEAYCFNDKASHSSLGYTEKRKAQFMPPGTIYMYYARGGDSLCISTRGEGNSILIKSGIIHPDTLISSEMTDIMQQLNPVQHRGKIRPLQKLCSGQTLLCKSLNLKVLQWDKKQFDKDRFFIEDSDYIPEILIQTQRLGIREDRDAQLFFRFIDKKYSSRSTKDVLRQKNTREGSDYFFLDRKSGYKPIKKINPN
ncbi:MAG: DNA-3-methyladenine glycosylase [Spirochaetaceae bacterium]|nr:DNA-3-methyladenine glycosylase [Spirochaetaceae bacterium]